MELWVQTQFLRMDFASAGPLVPWLGPAIRGMLAQQIKQHFCRWPPQEQQRRWRFCRGCPHQQDCPYGLTFEPDPPSDWRFGKAQADGQRAICLAPFFPVDNWAEPGDAVQVRLCLLGQQAIQAGHLILEYLQSPDVPFRLGKHKIKVRFTLMEPEVDWPAGIHRLRVSDLNSSHAEAGRIPWLRLELTAPLFLKDSSDKVGRDGSEIPSPRPPGNHFSSQPGENSRNSFDSVHGEPMEDTQRQIGGQSACVDLNGAAHPKPMCAGQRSSRAPGLGSPGPDFGRLFRACLRTVGRAFGQFGQGLLEDHVDFQGLKQLADSVPTQAAFWKPFRQMHLSHRQAQRYCLRGLVGGAVFTDVPVVLLPWLLWGGRFGVGEYRVAGAGTWRIGLR
jgi:hypothetical protein